MITGQLLSAYGAAALGYIFTELIKVGGRRPKTKFVLSYYFEQNWENLLANVAASLLLLIALPEIARLETKYFGDNYVILTAGFIGLSGSWILRTIIDKAKARVPDLANVPAKADEAGDR